MLAWGFEGSKTEDCFQLLLVPFPSFLPSFLPCEVVAEWVLLERKEKKQRKREYRLNGWMKQSCVSPPGYLRAWTMKPGTYNEPLLFLFFWDPPFPLSGAGPSIPRFSSKSFSAAFQRANSMAAIKTWRRSEDGMDGWIDQLNSFAHGTVSHDVIVVLSCKIRSPEQLCVRLTLPVGVSKRGSNFCWSLRCYLRWMLLEAH